MTFSDDRLIFVLGPPRGGTTLLMRLLHAHPEVAGGPEPHLLTPLAHLGVPHHVDRASYDPFVTAEAISGLVERIGEDTWYRALRAASDTVYSALAGLEGRHLLVDKTPAYSLIWPFVAKLYPNALFLVITRHPAAVFSSYAQSFFEDDWSAAHAHNPILERYVPALGGLLRSDAIRRRLHLRYEDLVAEPEAALRAVCEKAHIEYTPTMLDYRRVDVAAGPGDPTTVDRATRPLDTSVDRWVHGVRRRPERREQLARMFARLDDRDLEAWGFPRARLFEALEKGEPGEAERRPWDLYRAERLILLKMRKNLDRTGLRGPLRRLRFALDVLLRD